MCILIKDVVKGGKPFCSKIIQRGSLKDLKKIQSEKTRIVFPDKEDFDLEWDETVEKPLRDKGLLYVS